MANDVKESVEDLLKDLKVATKGSKDLLKASKEVDVTDKEELAKEMLKLTNEDRAMADKIFKLFYPEIMSGHDRSQASKEALTKALELRINAGRNIIDLIKLMKEEEKVNNSIGLFFSEKKAGINLDNIKTEWEE